MAALLCVVFMLAKIAVSDGAWCVCRPDVSEAALQKTLDYACGAGADCTTIQQGGACYNPNNVRAHCSYAANSYYQRKGQNQQACDFSGTAILTPADPSSNGCSYPASASAAGTSSGNTNTPTSTTNSSSSSSTATPTSTSSTPSTFTPSVGGVLGGGGLGPTGNSISSTDPSDASFNFPNSLVDSLLFLTLSFLLMIKGLI